MVWKPDYVELEAAKDFLRLTTTADDEILPTHITTASRAVDNYCNRQFGKVDAPEERVYAPWYNRYRGVWVVEIDDLQDVTDLSVVIDGEEVPAVKLEDPNAVKDLKAFTSLVIPWDSPVTPPGDVSITALWGWGSFPAPVVDATYLQLSRFYSRRNSPYGIAGSPDQGSELRLLSRLDPDAQLMVEDYWRPKGMVG